MCLICICLLELVLSDDQLKAYALAEIEMLLQSCGKSLFKYPPMPTADLSLVPDVQNRIVHEEINYNRPVSLEEHKGMMSTMTAEQRTVYDRIMARVDEGRHGLFFLYGYDGTGKTFI